MTKKIKITAIGLYGQKGPIKVGSVFDVQDVPAGWAGKCQIIGEESEDAVAVTNDEPGVSKEDLVNMTEEQLAEMIEAMDKDDLIKFADTQEFKIDKRKKVDELRAEIFTALTSEE